MGTPWHKKKVLTYPKKKLHVCWIFQKSVSSANRDEHHNTEFLPVDSKRAKTVYETQTKKELSEKNIKFLKVFDEK